MTSLCDCELFSWHLFSILNHLSCLSTNWISRVGCASIGAQGRTIHLAEDLRGSLLFFPSHQISDGSIGRFKWVLSGWYWGCDIQRCQLLRLCRNDPTAGQSAEQTERASQRQQTNQAVSSQAATQIHCGISKQKNIEKHYNVYIQGNQQLRDRVDLSNVYFS